MELILIYKYNSLENKLLLMKLLVQENSISVFHFACLEGILLEFVWMHGLQIKIFCFEL